MTKYVEQGFGISDSFWKKESMVKMLLDVRIRKTSLEAQIGVSRLRIVEKCGGVRDNKVVEKMLNIGEEKSALMTEGSQFEL